MRLGHLVLNHLDDEIYKRNLGQELSNCRWAVHLVGWVAHAIGHDGERIRQ